MRSPIPALAQQKKGHSMITASTPSNKPTHRVYAVTKRGEKSYWADIGAVWAHRDGKGFNVKLNMLPLGDAEIVIREPLPEDATDEGQSDAVEHNAQRKAGDQ